MCPRNGLYTGSSEVQQTRGLLYPSILVCFQFSIQFTNTAFPAEAMGGYWQRHENDDLCPSSPQGHPALFLVGWEKKILKIQLSFIHQSLYCPYQHDTCRKCCFDDKIRKMLSMDMTTEIQQAMK